MKAMKYQKPKGKRCCYKVRGTEDGWSSSDTWEDATQSFKGTMVLGALQM